MPRSDPRFLAAALAARSLFVPAGFVLIVALANLLFDFFGNKIDGGVEVRFKILCVKVRSRHVKEHGTLELPVCGLGGVVFQNDTSVDRETVQSSQLIEAGNNVILNGLGEGNVVRRDNQFHQWQG